MQKILIIGYLGRDPELKYSPRSTVVAQFSIASTERWKDKNGELQERTEWFAIKAFGRRAAIAGEYLHKGSRVYLEGRKRTESWDDKKTGPRRFLHGKREGVNVRFDTGHQVSNRRTRSAFSSRSGPMAGH